MTNFGIICPPAIGHLNPMCALGRELQRRGHQVTFFSVPDIHQKIINAGLNFWQIGEVEFPLGSIEDFYQKLGQTSGLTGLKLTIEAIRKEAAMLFQELPKALKDAKIEALLIDQITSAGGTIAEYCQLPFITICNAMLVNRETGVPPFFTSWNYIDTWWARLRNQLGNSFIDRTSKPIIDTIAKQRQRWNLPAYSNREELYSKLAQICQLPAEFDFPRVKLAPCFHYTGSLQDPSGLEPVSSSVIAFPFEKLTDQPLIYASLGTLQNRKMEIFQQIAESCLGLKAQLVISLGQPDNQEPLPNFPGSTIVVNYAPHQQLIEKAALVITHAGMNTTIGSLSSGIPLIAIPITNEQPGIAARIAWTGAGEVIHVKQLNVAKLRQTIEKVLSQNSYKENATRIQEAIRRAGGVSKAADIIEQVISTGKPVVN
jgi:UDP:flavonoid glycosyltransferase YjiC (YdhE family)